MRGLTRSLNVALATRPAFVCTAAGLVAVLAGALVVSPSAADAQQASHAVSRQAREKETGMLHWGTTVVWFRATDSDSVQVFASAGFRNPFAHPITVSADDVDRWAEFTQRLVVLSGAAADAAPDSAGAPPDTAHMVLGAGDVTLETTSDQDGMALRMNIGANRQDGVTAMLFADGAPTAAAALHDAARTARTLYVAAAAQAQAAAAAAAAPQTAASTRSATPSASAPVAASASASAAPAATTMSAHNAVHPTTRGMTPVVVSATSTPVAKTAGDPTPGGVDDVTVRNLVQQWQPELLYCYTEYGLRSHPDLSGTAVVRVGLAQDGTVGYVGIVRHSWSGEGSADVENCIRTKVSAWRFPPAALASAHEFPLSFSR
jgi:hypothetical protein